MQRVMGAIEQDHRAALFGVEDRLPGGMVRCQLHPVSVTTLLPALHPMVKPLRSVVLDAASRIHEFSFKAFFVIPHGRGAPPGFVGHLHARKDRTCV